MARSGTFTLRFKCALRRTSADILVGLFVWPRMGNLGTCRQECRRSAGSPTTRECVLCGGRASDKVAMDCGGKRSATPLSLPVKSAWFKPLRHFNPKRHRAPLAVAVHTCGARYLVGDFVTGRVVVGKSSAIETAKAPPAGLAGSAGGDTHGAGQGASRGRADTRPKGVAD